MATKVLAAGASGNASTDANWVGGAKPVTADDIDIHQGGNITWDLALALGTYFQTTGYTGTVTQAATFSTGDVNIIAGIFAFSNSYTWTCNGGFYYTTAGNHYLGNLVLAGAAKSFYMADSLQSLAITGSYIWDSRQTGAMYCKTINNSGRYTIPWACTQWVAMHTGVTTFINTGLIDGAGKLYFYFFGSNGSVAVGNVNCQVEFFHDASGTIPTITLLSDSFLGSSLYAYCATSYTILLDLANYMLQVAGNLRLGLGGRLIQRTGRIVCDSFTEDNANVIFTQGGPFIVGNAFVATAGVFTGDSNHPTVIGGPKTVGATITGFLFTNCVINEAAKVNRPINWMMNL